MKKVEFSAMRICLYILLTVLLFPAAQGCKKDAPDVEPYPTDSIGKINRWILDSMRQYYYWSDDIPKEYDYSQSPDQFFKSLLSPNDRFSWISDGQLIRPPSTSYFTYGFHFSLVQAPGYPNYIGVVNLVNKGGPADRAALHRGSYFIKVNGVDITDDNKAAVIAALKQTGQVKITPAEYVNNTWNPLPEITLRSGFSNENPVHYTRSFTAGGITTGYLYYNSFDENYDAQLLQAVAKLKNANVRELILDLRYNAGGSVASSGKLAALLANGLTGTETYVIYEGNRHEGRKARSLQTILSVSGNNNGKQYTDLQAGKLSLQRVFILTTGATVSAAELIVNNLKPFMTVVQIGETTAGKDEGSFLIDDERVPKQVSWSMQPTIYKLFNKNNVGGYHDGLTPQYAINEMAELPLADIGEPADPLVQKALQIIYGNNMPVNFLNLRKQNSVILPVRTIYSSMIEQALLAPVISNY